MKPEPPVHGARHRRPRQRAVRRLAAADRLDNNRMPMTVGAERIQLPRSRG